MSDEFDSELADLLAQEASSDDAKAQEASSAEIDAESA